MARWNLLYVKRSLDKIKAENSKIYYSILEETHFTDEESTLWREISDKIYLPKMEGVNILEQFEGYFKLEDCIIEKYDKNDWPIRPEILKTIPVYKTRLIKQADIVMLLHLLREEFTEQEIKDNYYYYEKRTMHGSSLSPSIYAITGLKIGDAKKAYRYLKRAAFIDLLNLQKNTREGIHAANAGGVWQVVIFGFAGVDIDEAGELSIKPSMPKEWRSLKFRLHHREKLLEITVYGDNRYEVKNIS